jgi:hypothetical protein
MWFTFWKVRTPFSVVLLFYLHNIPHPHIWNISFRSVHLELTSYPVGHLDDKAFILGSTQFESHSQVISLLSCLACHGEFKRNTYLNANIVSWNKISHRPPLFRQFTVHNIFMWIFKKLPLYSTSSTRTTNTKVCRKVPGLAGRSDSCKRYSSLPPGAVVSLFCEPV